MKNHLHIEGQRERDREIESEIEEWRAIFCKRPSFKMKHYVKCELWMVFRGCCWCWRCCCCRCHCLFRLRSENVTARIHAMALCFSSRYVVYSVVIFFCISFLFFFSFCCCLLLLLLFLFLHHHLLASVKTLPLARGKHFGAIASLSLSLSWSLLYDGESLCVRSTVPILMWLCGCGCDCVGVCVCVCMTCGVVYMEVNRNTCTRHSKRCTTAKKKIVFDVWMYWCAQTEM